MLGNKGASERASRHGPRESGEPVRRIDWNQCTLLGSDAVRSHANATEAKNESAKTRPDVPENIMAALKDLFERIVFDDSVPLYVATLDGHLVHVNDGYRNLVSEQVTGMTGGGANSFPAGLLAVVEEVRGLGKSVTLEEKVHMGGRLRHFRSRHFPVTDKAGNTIAVGGTYIDCTAQVEGLAQVTAAQQRFRDFARASSDWFWESDRDGCLTMLSDRLTALLGVPAAAFVGMHIEQAGRFKAAEYEESGVLDAMAGHRSFREQLYEMEDAQGRARLFHLSGVAVFDPVTGEFDGYRGAGMDVTDRVLNEQEASEARHNLENALEELTNRNLQLDMASVEAANALKVKNEFLAAMSHELRTPLNAIIGFAEAMKMEVFGELNSSYRSYSKDIMNAGRHLLGLINDVLDVAVLESNKISLDLERVSLKELIEAALNLVIMRANKKQLDTSMVAVSGDWTVTVDVRRATQIFVNLFSNAVKFTPDQGRIGVDIERRDEDWVAVTVWDTGIGIPEDKRELVFEKFQQLNDSVYARTEEGTGLGLHISRHLARLMGGDITLASEPGKGSRFTVLLPLSPEKQGSGKA